MKYLICSDIHGSEICARAIADQFCAQKCDFIILLGDILYHGPRNPLPVGHNPQGVVTILNQFASKIIACRGNCDAEVDQLLLKFHLMSDYALVVDNGVRLFCTHGHIFTPDNAQNCDVFLSGHTHVQVLQKNNDGILICNPGSTSLPKENSPAGFAVYEDRTITLYEIDGKKIRSLAI